MTKDPTRLHGDTDLGNNEAEMYAALWALAPFPRLPEDAPSAIKHLTVEIHEPKRVYAVYKAARRHQFQVLVERFIYQIRYGCQSSSCHTQSCFSYRKRLANGAPIRRYNATSARTLAVHLASLDNPEQGLCSTHRSEREMQPGPRTSETHLGSLDGDKAAKKSQDGLAMNGYCGPSPKRITKHTSKATEPSGEPVAGGRKPRSLAGESTIGIHSKMRSLEGPVRVDHRSFVQNVFETAAFKMVEWLAPRRLQVLSSEGNDGRQESPPVQTPDLTPVTEETTSKDSGSMVIEQFPHVEHETDQPTPSPETGSQAGVPKNPPRTTKTVNNKPRGINSQRPDSFFSPSLDERPVLRRKNSHLRTSSDSLEHHSPKVPLHHPSKTAEVEMGHFAQVKSPKQKFVRQALISSTAPRLEESPPPEDLPDTPSSNPDSVISPPPNNDPKLPSNESNPVILGTTLGRRKPKRPRSKRSRKVNPHTIPQSMSYLTAEAIQILCDIMEGNEICEKHDFQPQKLAQEIRVEVVDLETSVSKPWLSTAYSIPRESRLQWLSFAEQSLFDVLGRPKSLLKSFRHSEKLYDNLSVWFLMLRMTRVAPSIVYDSLWQASASLFNPPKDLETTYDWARAPTSSRIPLDQPLSDLDAAHLITLCLQALITAMPLVQDSRKLMNMSRIRSYGQSMLGRDTTALEPVSLCLQYEDAFTNDHAMRLARRVFAAIPIRRRFTELLEPQEDATPPAPDVLDLIFDTLRSELGVQPILGFEPSIVNIHETRVCTLIMDWARTVMLQEWHGSAEVPIDGAFGGALMTIAAIYQKRKSLLLGDIHFQTQYFADRLDPVTTPREWTAFIPNKKTIHLLDYPYLFNPEILVTYFRAINFSQMNHAYETSKATSGLMSTAMSGSHNLMINRNRRERLYDQLRTATSTFLVLEIRRTDVLLDAFNSIWRREERELLRPIKLRLGEDGGEEGLDAGGVQQEFFVLAIAEALDPNYGTFTVDERTRMTWFQPGSIEPLWKFELIGTIISLAVYNGLTLPITFPKALYQRLLGEDVNELHHIADGWPDLAAGLTTLLEWNEADGAIEDVFARTYEFSVMQFGQHVSRDMTTTTSWPQFRDALPNGGNTDDAPLVTNANRNNYVSDYIRWLTDISIRPQFEAFKRGFFKCFSPRSISLFDASTLQSLIEGVQDIDIPELRRITRYIGWDASHRAVKDFWSVVKKFDSEQKRKLLEFCTASDRVPVGGTRNLQFTLQKNGVGDDHLPTSYTCFGILLMPEYSSKEVLREKLGMALENSKGFGFA